MVQSAKIETVYDTAAGRHARERVERERVALVDLLFSDITGGVKALTIPATLLAGALAHGYRFDGAALTGGMRQVELDLFLLPDPSTLVIVPRREDEPRRAKLYCSVRRRDGQPFAGDPRAVLERTLLAAASAGYDYRVGIELEYYLVRGDLAEFALTPSRDAAGYFDVGEETIAGTRDEVLSTLHAMDVGVGGAHHETGPGQEELDLRWAGGIRMADQLMMVRQVIRAVAQRRGLRATFMPKPFPQAPGSGMHLFQRLARYPEGGDLLRPPGSGDDLSPIGRYVIAGQLAHARAMSAVICPTVNSYKRLAAGHRAPRHATWARVSQASLIRVPAAAPGEDADIELRLPDPMANPYLALAVALACGLDGINQAEEPPGPFDESLVTYDDAELDRLGTTKLPATLGDALIAFAEDDVVRVTLGDYIFEQLLTVKRAEWDDYRRYVSPWEHARYGDA